MHTVTIREAKARLNALVDAAERGEQVVLMRGSRLVAAIVPLSPDDFELVPRLTDPQAERLHKPLAKRGLSYGTLRVVAHQRDALRRGAQRLGGSSARGERARRPPPRRGHRRRGPVGRDG